MVHFSGFSTALNVPILTTGVTLGPPAAGPYPGVYCSVYVTNSSVLALISPARGGLAMENPFLVNVDGSYAFVGTDSSYTVVFSVSVPASTAPREVCLPSFPTSGLPTSTSASAGRIVRLTDGNGGVWLDTGSGWVAVPSTVARLSLTDKLLIGSSPAFGPADEAIGLSYLGVIYARTHDDDANRALIGSAPIQNIPGGTNHGNDGVMLGDTSTVAVCPGDDTTTLLGDRLLRWSGLHTGAGTILAPGWCAWATIDPSSDANYDRLGLYNDGTFYWFVTQAGGTGVRQNIRLSAPVVAIDGRLQGSMGAAIAAANNLTLGMDGNLFHITGATQINAITTANWQAGSQVTCIFDSTPTVKHNTAGGAGTAKILLAGAVDFGATANDTLTLRYDGASWFEQSRAVI